MVTAPQQTRALASKIQDMEKIERVEGHNGSIGAIDIVLKQNEHISQSRFDKMLPSEYKTKLVIGSRASATVYVEKR